MIVFMVNDINNILYDLSYSVTGDQLQEQKNKTKKVALTVKNQKDTFNVYFRQGLTNFIIASNVKKNTLREEMARKSFLGIHRNHGN